MPVKRLPGARHLPRETRRASAAPRTARGPRRRRSPSPSAARRRRRRIVLRQRPALRSPRRQPGLGLARRAQLLPEVSPPRAILYDPGRLVGVVQRLRRAKTFTRQERAASRAKRAQLCVDGVVVVRGNGDTTRGEIAYAPRYGSRGCVRPSRSRTWSRGSPAWCPGRRSRRRGGARPRGRRYGEPYRVTVASGRCQRPRRSSPPCGREAPCGTRASGTSGWRSGWAALGAAALGGRVLARGARAAPRRPRRRGSRAGGARTRAPEGAGGASSRCSRAARRAGARTPSAPACARARGAGESARR